MRFNKIISSAILSGALLLSGTAQADEKANQFALIDINKVAQAITASPSFKSQEDSLSAEWKKISDARAALQKRATSFSKLTDEQRKTKENVAKAEALQKDNQAQLELEKTFQDKYFQQKEASMKKMTDDVRAKVSAFAKKQGFKMVFNAGQVWYPGSAKDITQDIIKQFNG